MRSRTSAPGSGRPVKVEIGMVTSYPTPPVSTIAWLGCFSISAPRSKAIISPIVRGLPGARVRRMLYSVAMSVEAKQLESGVAVITISGRLAIGGEVERLESAVNGLLKNQQKKFVLDITGLEYVDSSGVGMLVASLTQVKKAGGDLRLAGANARIQRILNMTGGNSLIPM